MNQGAGGRGGGASTLSGKNQVSNTKFLLNGFVRTHNSTKPDKMHPDYEYMSIIT